MQEVPVNALILSRIQFGLALTFHFIFPATTLGLSFIILICETLYLSRSEEQWKTISSFLIKIFALVFAMGVATGIMLPFSFGANWSRFSLFAGEIFGLQLAIESVTAFALESVFLAIVLFGRSRVSKNLYFLSVFLVFFGSHLSAFWIISANSFMQTPAGYAVEGSKLVLASLYDAIFNPSTVIRFVHTIVGAWIAGAVFTGAVCSYLILKKYDRHFTKRLITLCVILLAACSAVQPILGHIHIMNVLKYQPVKDAAYEGIFATQKGAPLYGFGIPDADNGRIILGIGIPKGLSFLESFNLDAEVKGLNDFPKEQWPPVNVIFTTFHIMVPIAGILVAAALMGLFLIYRGRILDTPLYCNALILIVPLPYIANEMGWIGAEVGRQPWTIYGLMKTAEASTTNISTGATAASLLIIGTLYISVFLLFITVLTHILRKEACRGGAQ
jgi:cytochrome d ubiquinol oxidase subunit I